jgi:SSS family solute:Na+ symporter/sodium/pantothenate symporter
MPGIEKTDEVIPRMAVAMTGGIPGGSLISGLILAAPFGAVMATVSAYLVVISSGLVRDIYHRFLNPQATERQLKLWTWGVMIAVGLVAIAANIYPPFLQAIVVSAVPGRHSSPCLMLCYWRQASAPGSFRPCWPGRGHARTLRDRFRAGLARSPFDPLIGEGKGLRPITCSIFTLIWGVLASAIAGIGVTLATPPPEKKLVSTFFDASPEASS